MHMLCLTAACNDVCHAWRTARLLDVARCLVATHHFDTYAVLLRTTCDTLLRTLMTVALSEASNLRHFTQLRSKARLPVPMQELLLRPRSKCDNPTDWICAGQRRLRPLWLDFFLGSNMR